MSDYELQIAVKNAPLLNLMRKNGITTLKQLAELADVGYQQLCKLANLKMTIYSSKGEVRLTPAKISDFFNVMPEELAPEPQHYTALAKNKVAIQVNAEQMFALTHQTEVDPVALVGQEQMQKAIRDAISGLTVRQQTVLTKRFLEGKTLQEIGDQLNVTTARVRQIEQKALRVLRHPKMSMELHEHLRNVSGG